LIETARVFGLLLKERNWKPRRTVILNSWDAEEYGLIGSVEFLEKYYTQLFSQAIIYFNLDVSVTGTDIFEASGSPSLTSILSEIAGQTNITTRKGKSKTVASLWDPQELDTTGCGSDDCGFMHHVGVPIMHLGFSSSSNSYEAVYHSNYDSFHWMDEFGDPRFLGHEAVCKIWGRAALQFIDNEIIPFSMTDYATGLQGYITSLSKTTKQVDFTPLFEAAATFSKAATQIQTEISGLGKNPSDLKVRSINDRLTMLEKSFITFDPVLVGRKWFRHVIYTPSRINQYDGPIFASIHDEISAGNFSQATYLVKRISQVIRSAANTLEINPWK